MTTALVTGGSGFIGSFVVRALLRRGVHPRVLALPQDPVANLKGIPVEILRGDIRDSGSLERALKGCSQLYHLAGTPQLWVASRRIYHQINVLGTRNVMRAAARSASLERIVYTSTESIIGPSQNGGPCTEKTPSKLYRMVGPYCRSKLLAEREALVAAAQGLPVVVVNPTLPVGPGDIHLTPPGKMITDFLQGKIQGYIACGLNMADVRGIAEGHLLAAAHGRVGERYILAGPNMRLQEIFSMLAEISGVPAPRRRVPWLVALIFSYLAEFVADHFTHRPPLSNVTGVKLARYFMYFDSRRAVVELGYPQYPLRRALEEAVQWFREQGYAP